MYPNRQRQAKRGSSIRLRGLLLIAAVIVLVVAALFIFGVFKPGSTATSNLTHLSFNAASNYVLTKNGLLYIKDNNLIYESLDRGKGWSSQLASTDVQLSASANINVVFNAASMMPLGKDGTPLFDPVPFKGTSPQVRCGNSLIAVLMLDPAGSPNIYVYDSKGVALDLFPFEGSSVVDFGFFGPDDDLWVYDINTNGVTIMSTISTFAAGKTAHGNMYVDGQVLEKLYFRDKSIYAVGTSQLLAFDPNGNETDRKLIYGWRVCDYYYSGSPYFLIVPRQVNMQSQGGIAKLVTLPSTTKDTLLTLPAGSLGAWIFGDSIVSVTKDTMSYFNYKGELKKNQKFDEPITGAVKINDYYLMVERGGELYLSKVK